jgi:hypothetical protein
MLCWLFKVLFEKTYNSFYKVWCIICMTRWFVTRKGFMRITYKSSCNSFLVFRSKPPYDNLASIAHVVGSETSIISSINNIWRDTKLCSNKTIIVPIGCSCSGNIYQHNIPYTVKKGDTYYHLVNGTYQSKPHNMSGFEGSELLCFCENIAIDVELTFNQGDRSNWGWFPPLFFMSRHITFWTASFAEGWDSLSSWSAVVEAG